jgi:hypothetical protein
MRYRKPLRSATWIPEPWDTVLNLVVLGCWLGFVGVVCAVLGGSGGSRGLSRWEGLATERTGDVGAVVPVSRSESSAQAFHCFNGDDGKQYCYFVVDKRV